MDLKDKIVGLALVALISLVGWNLKTTWEMKEQVFKLQQGQIFLSKQIKKNTNLVKRNIKNKRRKRKRLRMSNEIYSYITNVLCCSKYVYSPYGT